MKESVIYLSGPDSVGPWSGKYEWREYISHALPSHVVAISPDRGKRMFLGIDDRAISQARRVRAKRDVISAAAILVNVLRCESISIETVLEIAWASDHNLPVVMAMEKNGNPHDVPALQDAISVQASTLEEAVEAALALVSPTETLMRTRVEQIEMLAEENRFMVNTAHHGTYSSRPRRSRMSVPA